MAQIALNYSAAQINAAIAKINSLVSVIEGSIVQLYDGTTAIYPRTKAEAVFFDNDTSKTLDQQFSQLEQEVENAEYNIIDLLYGVSPINGAIKSDGSIQSHSSYKYYKISNNEYKKIVGQGSSYAGFLKVAFYNNTEISSSSFISGIEQVTSYVAESFNIDIPQNCVTIVVSQYSSVATICNGYIHITTDIENIKNDIININNQLLNKISTTEFNLVINQINNKIDLINETLFDEREYGDINDYYISGNSWIRIVGSISKYIKVKAGDVIHIEKNSNFSAYCACIESIDTSQAIVFKSGFTRILNTVANSTYNITEDCYFYWLYQYNSTQVYQPSILTLNGKSILTETYSINIIEDIREQLENDESAISLLNTSVNNLEKIQEDLVIQKEIKRTITDFSLAGYYASNAPTLIDNYGYKSCPLISVSDGQKVRLHNWIDYDSLPSGNVQQIFALYDNDNLPYNGTSARINVISITKISTGEYEYILPSNVSQLGVSINNFPQNAYLTINEGEYDLTQKFIDIIEESITPDEDTGDKSANYYLKGNSNIIYSAQKKLGIIAAGQSNIDGRNSYSDLPAGFVNPNNKVHFCNNTNGTFSDFQINDGGSGNDWSFDAIVYDLLTKQAYGNQSEIYVMKKSMGGTSIDKDGATDYHWTADYEYLSSPAYSLLRTFESIIRKATELQGSNFDIKAFLWHQGEGDADTLAVANRYYDNLKNMLAYVRGIIGNPRLHFFCGSISNNNTYNRYKDIINAAYFKLASEDPYFHLVDMSNAVLEDNWHFNYQWSIYFGQKVYDLMIDAGIISGTKINPTEPS